MKNNDQLFGKGLVGQKCKTNKCKFGFIMKLNVTIKLSTPQERKHSPCLQTDANNRSGMDVAHKFVIEGHLFQFFVMSFYDFLVGQRHFQATNFQTLFFKPLNDSSNQTSLDPIWFDHDVGQVALVLIITCRRHPLIVFLQIHYR